MTDLLDLLAEAAASGWLVNNLFQHDDATWQANLRSADRITGFGTGDTPEDALSAALDAMTQARTPPAPPTWTQGQHQIGERVTLSLKDFIGANRQPASPPPAPSPAIVRRLIP